MKHLDAPLIFTGQTVSLDGKPVSEVKFRNDDKRIVATSNAEGNYSFELPKGFEYTETIIDDGKNNMNGIAITISKDGFEDSKMLADPSKAPRHAVIEMRAHIVVTGLVINNYDQSLEGVVVTDMKSKVSTTSGSNGEFEIASTQYHILKIEKPGYGTINYALIDLINKPATVVMQVAKDVKVSGSVQNAKSEPLSGINIVVKGTTSGTITDQSGKFIIQADEDATLVFSFVGYKSQMVKISELDKSTVIIMQDEVYDILFPATTENKPADSPPPLPKQPKKGAEVFSIVENLPSYSGGSLDQLGRDIQVEVANILKLTQDRGVVKVGFTVSAEGKVVNPHVLESSNSKILDDSALKIVQKLDNWSPGVQRGIPVNVNLSLPVKFE
ncbi:MAG: TonB family protein [Cyclobacteriaceae bacterium]|nr:TonB family protein [Cyclobacteriaceae bacterium]